MILLRGITILRDLHHVEPKLDLQVRGLVLGIPRRFAIFRSQLRIFDSDCLVDRGVAGNVSRIVRERSQREGVLVDIPAFEQEFVDEVTAADVVRQIAELPVSERVVATILNDRAAIGIGVRLRDLVLRKPEKVL